MDPRRAVADQMESRGIAAAWGRHVPGIAQLADVIDFGAKMYPAQKIIQVLIGVIHSKYPPVVFPCIVRMQYLA
jgi:hypothetical protein